MYLVIFDFSKHLTIRYCTLLSAILTNILHVSPIFYHYFQKQPPEVFYKKGFLRNFAKFTEKQQCQSLFLIKFIKKETLAQVFSCEFCKISKKTFSTEYLRTTASVLHSLKRLVKYLHLSIDKYILHTT